MDGWFDAVESQARTNSPTCKSIFHRFFFLYFLLAVTHKVSVCLPFICVGGNEEDRIGTERKEFFPCSLPYFLVFIIYSWFFSVLLHFISFHFKKSDSSMFIAVSDRTLMFFISVFYYNTLNKIVESSSLVSFIFVEFICLPLICVWLDVDWNWLRNSFIKYCGRVNGPIYIWFIYTTMSQPIYISIRE